MRRLDLGALAGQVVAGYAQASWESGHTLSVQGEDGLEVLAHPLLLELALRNLVDNALQHTARGSCVRIQWGHDGGGAWLQVCDDGQARPDAAALSGERLGLGHKIVGRVMDVHGGRFEQADAPVPFTRCYRMVLPLTP
jgi:two-component system sensor histidine kinase QseC